MSARSLASDIPTMVFEVLGKNLLGEVRNLSRSASVQWPPAFRSAGEIAVPIRPRRARSYDAMQRRPDAKRAACLDAMAYHAMFSGPPAPTGIEPTRNLWKWNLRYGVIHAWHFIQPKPVDYRL